MSQLFEPIQKRETAKPDPTTTYAFGEEFPF